MQQRENRQFRKHRSSMLACALVWAALAAFVTLVGSSTQAGATAQGAPTLPATITVLNTNDGGPGSLRDAIAQAAPGDTINFTVTGAINLTSAALTINKDLTISGPGADNLSVERNSSAPDFRIFTVESGATVAIYGLSISQGRAAATSAKGVGGGIDNDGTLTLDSCRLTDNFAVDGGGGVHNAGTMSLKHCQVATNLSEGVGGGILNDGMMTISESVVDHNKALGGIAGVGGGIVNSGTLTLNNSTISSNFARTYGGALYNSGRTTINKSTIMENVCGGGGGVYNKESGNLSINASTIARNSIASTHLSPVADGVYNAGTATVATSIIAANGGTTPLVWDVEGAFVSQGYNLIGRPRFGTTGFTRGDRHDQIGLDNLSLNPRLGALRDNGGPTPTAALLCGSPAIDAGNDASTEPPLNFATDQRGRARRAGAHVDIGAFEVQPDDEHCRVLSIADATVVEGNSGQKLAVFNVSLSAPTADGVTFQYDTIYGSTGVPIFGVAEVGSDYDRPAGIATIAGGETSTTINMSINGDTIFEGDETFIVRVKFVTNAIVAVGWGIGTIINDDPSPVLQFSAPDYQVNEAGVNAVITVTRTGNSSDAFVINYATVDNPDALPCHDTTSAPASARCDYTSIRDRLVFAPGQMQQSFNVPIVDDAHAERAETFKVVLIASSGLVLGEVKQATITISDDDTGAGANPVDDSAFFVRQQYLDFLNREPEGAGFDAWMGVLNRCPNRFNFDPASPSAACDRITVSASFFNSPEFRAKAYFIYRFYRVALNRRPHYDEMVRDIRSITDQNEFEASKKRFAYYVNWVVRPEFRARYDVLTDTEYVDALLERYSGMGNIPPDRRLNRSLLVLSLLTALTTRAETLSDVVQSREADTVEFNGAFVAMQYFGYLRRDADPDGYAAWLNYLNNNPGDYRTMVNGFLNSQEYRLRFGAPQ